MVGNFTATSPISKVCMDTWHAKADHFSFFLSTLFSVLFPLFPISSPWTSCCYSTPAADTSARDSHVSIFSFSPSPSSHSFVYCHSLN